MLCFNYPAEREKLTCISIYIQSTYLSKCFMKINVFFMKETQICRGCVSKTYMLYCIS